MKLLGDIKMYCIKVDYFMWSEEKGEYTEPVYLSIDTETCKKDGTCANLICFKEDIKPNLRVFDTVKEAEGYIAAHSTGINISYENPEVVAIKYDFDAQKWVEV